MRNKIFALFALFILLTACASKPTLAPTNTIAPATKTLIPTLLAGTPRWVLYERALAYIFLGPSGRTLPDMSVDHGLCEWEIWGQKENEIYVYALCQVDNAIGTATSAPAVIRLGKDGTILEIEMPEEGYGNLKELFPEDVLAKILKYEFPGDAAWNRIQMRRKDSSIVPLIVEQEVVLP
jgi:hypothetical protein